MEKKYLKWGAFFFATISLISLAFFASAPHLVSILIGSPEGDRLCEDAAIQRYEDCARSQCKGAPRGTCYLVECFRPICPDLRRFALILAALSGTLALVLYYLSSKKN
jgi:hypothetical protein